jgi:hypothetical protein
MTKAITGNEDFRQEPNGQYGPGATPPRRPSPSKSKVERLAKTLWSRLKNRQLYRCGMTGRKTHWGSGR